VGELSSEEKISIFERNAADFAAIIGFTAKNLTKLQPKRLVFSTNYISPTGAKFKVKEIKVITKQWK
jgi:hypothetical protein